MTRGGTARVCTVCGVEKPLEDFHRHKSSPGGRKPACKDCQNERRRKYHQDNKQVQRKYKNNLRDQNRERVIRFLMAHPCVECGEDDPIVLDFHHVRDKVEDISGMVAKSLTWTKIRAEIEKCVVYCCCCHRRLHANAENTWRVRVLARLRNDKA